MAARDVIVLGGETGFRGGHTENPHNTDPVRWQGVNMLVNRDGLLVPRPGWKSFPVTFDSDGKGLVLAVGHDPDVTASKDAWVALQTYTGGDPTVVRVYQFSSTAGGAATFVGTITTTTVSALDWVNWLGKTYIVVPGNGVWVLDLEAGTVAKLAGDAPPPSNAGHCITVKNGNLIVGGVSDGAGGPHNRVYWSNFNDATTWVTAENYIEVPTVNRVSAFTQIRDTLYVSTNAGELFVISGPTPEQWVLRPVLTAGGPLHHRAVAVQENNIVFKPWTNIGRETPAVYACCKPRPLNDLWGSFRGSWTRRNGTWQNPECGIATVEHSGDVVFIDGSLNVVTMSQDGIWSRHNLASPVTAMKGSTALTVSASSGYDYDRLLVSDGGGDGVTPTFWTWEPRLDRPGFVSDAFAQPGDASTSPLTTSVKFAELWDPKGRDVRVHEVIVDFVSWATGSSTANSLRVGVDVTPAESPAGQVQSHYQDWVEEGSPSTSGSMRRVRFRVRQAAGVSFRPWLSNVRGVGIKRVSVVYDADPAPARGV